MSRDSGGIKLHVLTALIVGGVFFSAFVIYAALVLAHWIVVHPTVLVYGFMVLVAIQSYWLLHAYLSSRFRIRQTGPESHT